MNKYIFSPDIKHSISPAADSVLTKRGGHVIQPKLSIGARNNYMEHEADTMADKVMTMSKQPFTHSSDKSVSGEQVRAKPMSSFAEAESNPVSEGMAEQIQLSAGEGNALSSPAASFMESRFGKSFSHVRVHTGSRAGQLSEQLHAQAFTTGNNIYFNAGKYAPDTQEGKHLLAHELTHTIQQGGEPASVQKEDKDKTYVPGTEVDYKVLPPEFQLRLFHFLLQADTSKVHLDFNTKTFMTGLSYEYGSALSLNMRFREFSGKLGWEPGSNNLSLGINSGNFSSSLTANPDQQKYGLGLHYGAPLLPFQNQISSTFLTGASSFAHFASGLPEAVNDPIAYYKQNKSDIEDISKTVDLVKQITEEGKNKIRFGADFSLSYDPISKMAVTLKGGFIF